MDGMRLKWKKGGSEEDLFHWLLVARMDAHAAV